MVAQPFGREAIVSMPVHAPAFPFVEPVHVRARFDEELHLHLFELARAKNEVPRRDLVTERLADLRDAERYALPRRLLNIEEVDIRPLRGFRAQVDHRGGVLDGTDVRSEHQVELPRFGELTLPEFTRVLRRFAQA